MAPASNSAKALQQNRPRPAVPRAVVPAIPLPYVQKRQQQEAARARAREEAATPTVVETPAPSSPASTTAHISPAIVNGSSKGPTAGRPEESTEVGFSSDASDACYSGSGGVFADIRSWGDRGFCPRYDHR
jgi:hypothetical protein